MLCCSDCCPKYKECALACINVEYKNRLDQVENLYTYGSCSIQYVDGEVKMKENYMCGPTSNYAMFVPIIPEYDKIFRKFKDLNKYHQVTMDEWMEEKEKQDKEKEKMNDNIDVRVKVIPYIDKTGSIEMDFEHPLYVNSVWPHDELVELEHNGHKIIVSESELVKAAKLCSNNRW